MTPLEIHDQLCEALINTQKLKDRAIKLNDQIDLQCEINHLLESLVDIKKQMSIIRNEDSPLVAAAENLIRKVNSGNVSASKTVVHWRLIRKKSWVGLDTAMNTHYIPCSTVPWATVSSTDILRDVTCPDCRVLMSKEELEA